jgi:hypothetical protein
MEQMDAPFWKTKTLAEMTLEEWESLCDGCGWCCLHKVEYEDTGEVEYTCVACSRLNIDQCRCSDYKNRKEMPDCLDLTPETLTQFHWLPETCAYRRVSEGRDLEEWHHLISGDPETVHEAGFSLRDRAISEKYANMDELEAYIVLSAPYRQ